MPRTKRAFQEIREKSRQHILDEAAKVFASRGLVNTKASDLAKAAGISQGLLYWYFKDKDDVFVALLEQAIDGVTDYAQAAIQHAGTPLEKFHWLTEQILRGMTENPIYFRLISQALALSEKAQEAIQKFEPLGNILRELIIEGQTMGEIAKRNADQLIFLYISCLYGLAAGKSFNISRLDECYPPAEAILQILKP